MLSNPSVVLSNSTQNALSKGQRFYAEDLDRALTDKQSIPDLARDCVQSFKMALVRRILRNWNIVERSVNRAI